MELELKIFWRAIDYCNAIDISGEYICYKEANGKYWIESWQEDRFAEYNYTALITKDEFDMAQNKVLYLDSYRVKNNQTIFKD